MVINKCTMPPKGWHCTRKAGHDGPCAAIQDKDPFGYACYTSIGVVFTAIFVTFSIIMPGFFLTFLLWIGLILYVILQGIFFKLFWNKILNGRWV